MDIEGAQTWLNSLLYKLSYYRYVQSFNSSFMMTDLNRYGGQNVQKGKPSGWDRVRKAEIGNKDFELEFFEEVYTSSRWLVRVYRLRKPEEISSVNWY